MRVSLKRIVGTSRNKLREFSEPLTSCKEEKLWKSDRKIYLFQTFLKVLLALPSSTNRKEGLGVSSCITGQKHTHSSYLAYLLDDVLFLFALLLKFAWKWKGFSKGATLFLISNWVKYFADIFSVDLYFLAEMRVQNPKRSAILSQGLKSRQEEVNSGARH